MSDDAVALTVDGHPVRVPSGATLLDACRARGIDTPTLCYLESLTPVNVCRVCVVDVEGWRALVPACSPPAEDGMVAFAELKSSHVRHSPVRAHPSARGLRTITLSPPAECRDYRR